ncbi:hypothetical protein GGI07_000048 [Coemansia sp. Benny D115]|nr:hypothetical protein GGI07_000048 [Coemansia sp. Benny D115]
MSGDNNQGTATATYNEVTRYNIEALASRIRRQMAAAQFIAIDTEFTGLVLSNASPVFRFNTSNWVTRATDMTEKYRAMTNIAKTHALVSMGVSIFSRRHTVPGSHNVNNFNFLLQQQNSHLVNANSMSFLAENGFDLNKQVAQGIRYFGAPNPMPLEMKNATINMEGHLIREVFLDIVRARVPVIIHNGLFDLIYLYQSFFGPLPDTYTSFAYDLHEMFPGGIYDTKLISESQNPESPSFLAYSFHRNERVQNRRLANGDTSVRVRLKDRLVVKQKTQRYVGSSDNNVDQLLYCENFASHGACRFKERCRKSHDLNFILDCQEKAQQEKQQKEQEEQEESGAEGLDKKRKREDSPDEVSDQPDAKISRDTDQSAPTLPTLPATPKTPNDPATVVSGQASSAEKSVENMYHTAAYDAYMTGYIYASYRVILGKEIEQYKNKINLMNSNGNPLLIKSSTYATTSMTYKQTCRFFTDSKDTKKPNASTTVSAELASRIAEARETQVSQNEENEDDNDDGNSSDDDSSDDDSDSTSPSPSPSSNSDGSNDNSGDKSPSKDENTGSVANGTATSDVEMEETANVSDNSTAVSDPVSTA